MTGGYVDLEQARWDMQVATGQTVAGTGIEARMREARAAAGRLASGLPGLLDELEQLRRPQRRPLPVELADARAEIERLTKSRDRFVDHVRKIRAELPGVPLTGLATAVAELRDRAEVERLSAELADARAQLSEARDVLHEFVNVRGDFYEPAPLASMIERLAPSLGFGFRADWRNFVDRECRERDRAVAAERALEAVRALHVAYDCTAAGAEGHETCGQREWSPDLMAALRASVEAYREAAKQRRLGPAASGTPETTP